MLSSIISCFLQNQELNLDLVGNTTLASFQSVIVALISEVPCGWYCFWFILFAKGEWQFQGLALGSY